MGGIRGSRFPRGVDLRVCTRLAACPCERLKVRAAAAVAPRARARDELERHDWWPPHMQRHFVLFVLFMLAAAAAAATVRRCDV